LIAKTHADARFAEQYRNRFVEPRRAPARALVRRGIERGEIRADADVEAALDLLYGPIYHRLLNGHAPLNDRFVDAVVDSVLAGLVVSSSGAAPRSPRRRQAR
jgi:hypothetical protein